MAMYTVRPYQVYYSKILATGQILTLPYHFPLKQLYTVENKTSLQEYTVN